MKNSSPKKWKIEDTKLVFKSPYVSIRKEKVDIGNGSKIDDYFVCILPEVSVVFPFTKDNKVVLIIEYKHGVRKTFLGLPAGCFEKGKETPEKVAKRELLEETGYNAKEMVFLGKIYDWPTKATNAIHVFLAKNVEQTKNQKLDKTENIEVITRPMPELKKLIANGKIQSSSSIAAIMLATEYLEKTKK